MKTPETVQIMYALTSCVVGVAVIAGCFYTIWFYPEHANVAWPVLIGSSTFYTGGSASSVMKNFKKPETTNSHGPAGGGS